MRSALALVLGLGLGLSTGCSSVIGMSYAPERSYVDAIGEFHNVDSELITRVKETRWGVHWFLFRLKGFSVHEVVEESLAGNADYYVADLNVHVDLHGTITLTWLLGFMLPKLTVEFDVVEVKPWTESIQEDAPAR